MMKISGNDGFRESRLPVRREILRSGLHAAVIGTILGAANSRASATKAVKPCGSEIFAFRSQEAAELVFALTVPADHLALPRAGTHVVRIHAGSQSWTVNDAGQLSTATIGSRVLVGLTAKSTRSGAEPNRVTVVAAPLTSFPSQELPVWGEILGLDGSRARVGSPIASALLALDPDIARRFHRVSPDDDREVLARSMADLISTLRANAGSADPRHYGASLANTLLPNILPFDPRKPIGFTFAGQNGRHPSDQVADVVATVLSGVVETGRDSGGAFQTSNAFPYFLPLDA